jgi:hypothetical protein
MTITRYEVEQILSRRIGGYLTVASMTSDSGVNPWLTDPLRWALTAMGYTTASYTAVTDSDLAGVADARIGALLDLTELRALEAVYSNLTAVSNKAGPLQDDYNDLARRLEKMRDNKRAEILAVHGIDLGVGDAPPRLVGMAAL